MNDFGEGVRRAYPPWGLKGPPFEKERTPALHPKGETPTEGVRRARGCPILPYFALYYPILLTPSVPLPSKRNGPPEGVRRAYPPWGLKGPPFGGVKSFTYPPLSKGGGPNPPLWKGGGPPLPEGMGAEKERFLFGDGGPPKGSGVALFCSPSGCSPSGCSI